MIAWLVGIITFILLVLILWRGRSRTIRDLFERPKFQFLRNLGIAWPAKKEDSEPDNFQENKNGKSNS